MAKTEIVPATEADDAALAPVYDAAVKFVNERVESEAANLVEIGAYLLKNFFEDNIEEARSQVPNKELSIHTLAERDDINMSYSRLSRCLNLSVQEKDLGTLATSQELTASHKILLLAVEKVADKKKYVKAVESKKMSVRALRDQLVEEGHIQQRGMGALNEGKERTLARKGHRKLMHSFDFIGALDVEMYEGIDKKTAKKALTKAEAAKTILVKLINKLNKRVE